MLLLASPFPIKPPTGGAIPTDYEAFYEFENNLNDSSANGNTATDGGTSVTYTTGKFGTYAVVTNGTTQYIQLPTNSVWDELNGKNLSFFVWFKSTDTSLPYQVVGNYSTLTATGPTPNQFWQLVTNQSTGTARVVYRRDNAAELAGANGTTNVCDGSWHLLGYVKNGLTIELWVDNVMENSATLSSDGSCANNQPVRFAVQFARYQAETLDNSRIYPDVLTTEEKTALWNET
jgi:hypothetical protein